mmetsp:Transcript_71624/g.207402  ORF Transcript_71624/g.207402 Transcript_71624/m.207402 type:complete len:211 (-) Transcript_71624:928-1560(-)
MPWRPFRMKRAGSCTTSSGTCCPNSGSAGSAKTQTAASSGTALRLQHEQPPHWLFWPPLYLYSKPSCMPAVAHQSVSCWSPVYRWHSHGAVTSGTQVSTAAAASSFGAFSMAGAGGEVGGDHHWLPVAGAGVGGDHHWLPAAGAVVAGAAGCRSQGLLGWLAGAGGARPGGKRETVRLLITAAPALVPVQVSWPQTGLSIQAMSSAVLPQ